MIKIKDPDKFAAMIVQIGNSDGIIIPYQIMKYSGYEKGDILEVWIRKKPEFDEDDL